MLHSMQRGTSRAGDPANSRTVIKALHILRVLGQSDRPLGVVEIARRLGLHKSSVSRLLATLRAEGFVGRDGLTERFIVGPTVVSLAGSALRQMDLRQLARPILERLASDSGETVNLAVPAQGGVINIDKIASQHYIRDIGWIGRQSPFHATATGKVLIAWLTPRERRALVGATLSRHTPETITSWSALERELERVRRQGYATGREELEPGLVAVAGPIHGEADRPVATVSVSGPSTRLGPAEVKAYADLVVAAGREISARLSHFHLPVPV